jgi:FkbM family methyltransferase
MLKRVAAAGLGMATDMPGGSWLVAKAACAPLAVKTLWFARLASTAARNSKRLLGTLVETNAGIGSRLRLLVPSNKTDLLFGRPDHWVAERATLALACELSRHSSAFLDVGANEGLFTFAVAQHWKAGCHGIHCFEPDATVFSRLQHNLERNRIDAKAVQAAVGAETGTTAFYRNLSDDHSGSLTAHFADQQHRVIATQTRVVALADYLRQHNCRNACVKVDVEGAGVAVWDGAKAALDRIDWLICEIIGPEARANLPKRIITESGWCAYYIRDFTLVPSRDGSFEYHAPFYNWLFCRLRPWELATQLAETSFVIADQNGD